MSAIKRFLEWLKDWREEVDSQGDEVDPFTDWPELRKAVENIKSEEK